MLKPLHINRKTAHVKALSAYAVVALVVLVAFWNFWLSLPLFVVYLLFVNRARMRSKKSRVHMYVYQTHLGAVVTAVLCLITVLVWFHWSGWLLIGAYAMTRQRQYSALFHQDMEATQWSS
jgi:hypothetical protein